MTAAEARPIREIVAVVRPLHRATIGFLDADDLEDDNLARLRAQGIDALRTHRWRELIPPVFLAARLSQVQDGVRQELARWVTSPGVRPSLLLFGAVGVGKTHAAVAAMRDLHARGIEVRMLTVPELLDRLRPSAADPVDIYDLADIDVLLLDDVGAEQATGWTSERLATLVNRRWLEQRPTVITTNLTPAELRDHLGARTYSRLTAGGLAVVLTGPDRRSRHV